ncbi:hypothetical protein [Enterovirga sp. CN4-39]|uniref:hypothetical protein n=1 Tax=Enterovirga sp. CN4-39 TaxID=3400910 RepID=UPI003C0A2C10
MAKGSKTKLPKTVAGIKIPKGLRKSGVLETLVGSQAGRQLLADAIMAAATAAASVLAGKAVASAAQAQEGTARPAQKGREGGAGDGPGGAIAGLITEAAEAMLSPRSEAPESEKTESRKPKKKGSEAGAPKSLHS